jgi:general secretion pathway protein H
MSRRAAEGGLTLIEMSIAIAIVAVLFSAVVTGVGALTGAKAKASAGELAGVMRSLYDTAALSGKTCRLVFELPQGRGDERSAVRYHAECAASGVTTARDRDGALAEAERKGGEERPRRDERVLVDDDDGPSLDELLTGEERRVEHAATFSAFTSEAVKPRQLPSDVRVAIWTRQQRGYAESGVAHLYFFPQGFTEKAQVRLSQGDNTWTLKMSPLTGKVTVVAEALEVPRS